MYAPTRDGALEPGRDEDRIVDRRVARLGLEATLDLGHATAIGILDPDVQIGKPALPDQEPVPGPCDLGEKYRGDVPAITSWRGDPQSGSRRRRCLQAPSSPRAR